MLEGWIGEKPAIKLERGCVRLMLQDGSAVRIPDDIARETAGDIIFMLDERSRKPSNVRPFKRR